MSTNFTNEQMQDFRKLASLLSGLQVLLTSVVKDSTSSSEGVDLARCYSAVLDEAFGALDSAVGCKNLYAEDEGGSHE